MHSGGTVHDVTAKPRGPLLPNEIRACLFDLDGVLTDTVAVHAEAWKRMFDEFLEARAIRERLLFVPFDLLPDYQEHIDGRQRFDGVRSFLSSRGIELAEGTREDPPDAETIGGLGNRKNELVLTLIRARGVQAYAGSVRFVQAVRDAGLRRAVVSASANCREVLESAGISDLFEIRVDGVVAARDHLPGKPAPDMYLAAARCLDVRPDESAVFEDALAGVAAGRSGRFRLVVGVDRVGQAEALLTHGADVVVSDHAELLETS